MAYHTEQTEIGMDIVIDGWNQGVIDDPYHGLYDLRNVDTVTIPGEVSVAMSTQVMNTQAPITGVTFTISDVLNYIFQYNGTVPLEVNTPVVFSNTGGALPNGLSAHTAYYIVTIVDGTHFKVSNTAGGSVTTFSDTGSGTNSFSTINMGVPQYFTDTIIVQNNYRVYFLIDDFGRAWVLNNFAFNGQTNGNTGKWVYMHNLAGEYLTSPYQFRGYGNGLIAWKKCLFTFDPNSISVMRLEWASSPSLSKITTISNWINNWQTVEIIASATQTHYPYHSINDDSIYFCNVSSVGYFAQDTSSIDNPNQNPFWPSVGRSKTDGVTTSGSPTITSATMAFVNGDIGSPITGTNIPANSYIIGVTNSTTATIGDAYGNSVNATNSGTALTFTIPTTWLYSASILPLPNDDQANCLAELGTNLMVGGINNYIYPWDRVSPNFYSPIFLSEYRVSRMVTINTTMYIFCGFKGRIYVTNGANATPFYKIPEYLSGTTNPYFFWTDASFSRNQLYFGFQATDNSGNTISTLNGLWAIDVDSVQPTAPRLQNIMSYGTYAGYVSAIHVNRQSTPQLLPSGDGYGMFMGWWDGVTTVNGANVGNVDKGISTPYTGGQSYAVTDPVPIGQYLNKKTPSGIEYKLATPLVTGETVTISYRTQLSGSFTDNPLTDTDSAGLSAWGVPVFEKSQWVQFQLLLTSTATNPSYCRVREIRLHMDTGTASPYLSGHFAD